MSVEIGDASDEGHVCKESIDPVEWKEGFGIKKNANEREDSVHKVGGDGGILFLFTIEVGKGSIGGAEGTSILLGVFVVARVFVREQIFKERMKTVASFGNLFSCSNDLFFVEANWKSMNARGRLSIFREGVGGRS